MFRSPTSVGDLNRGKVLPCTWLYEHSDFQSSQSQDYWHIESDLWVHWVISTEREIELPLLYRQESTVRFSLFSVSSTLSRKCYLLHQVTSSSYKRHSCNYTLQIKVKKIYSWSRCLSPEDDSEMHWATSVKRTVG